MGKRKVTILDSASEAIAEIAFFVESQGLPDTSKKFVDKIFTFLETLSDNISHHRDCHYKNDWKYLGYKCVTFGKFVVAYLDQLDEIIICDFVPSKMLKT